MSRSYFVNGETMVYVKGRSDSAIASLSELGLTDEQGIVTISLNFAHEEINVDAWRGAPAEMQWMLADATITMTLINFDYNVLNTCLLLSMGGAPGMNVGQMGRAGQLMGNGLPRFAPAPNGGAASTGTNAGNNYIGLNLSSPVGQLPWRFFFAYLAQPPINIPLGTQKSLMRLTWRAIPYTTDPWGNGTGAYAYPLFDHTLDN